MRIGYHAAALGAMQQQKRLELTANNLANVGTAGFKRDGAYFSDFMKQFTYTRMDQGGIRSTGHPLDVALVGEGFLRVQGEGEVLYTRAGNLKLDPDNTLTTQDGLPVLGQNGPIQVQGIDIRIDESGQVFDDNEPVDTLDLVKFSDQTALVKAEHGYFKPSDGAAAPEPAEECRVQQGFIEEANFNITEEMVQMIEALRTFEAYQKTLQSFQEADSQLIDKIGTL